MGVGIDKVRFEVVFGKEKVVLEANLRGSHFVENLLGAILIARNKGVVWEAIKRACLSLETIRGTMKVRSSKDVVVIDDTHNATPAGFRSALEYLKAFKNKKKIVITPGIIELGNLAGKIHEDLGRRLSKTADMIIVTDNTNGDLISKGFKESGGLLATENLGEIIGKLKEGLKGKWVILMEGRIPGKVYEYVSTLLSLRGTKQS